MGNCAGILSACQGEEQDQNHIRKINQEAMALALDKNREF